MIHFRWLLPIDIAVAPAGKPARIPWNGRFAVDSPRVTIWVKDGFQYQ
jgi:hypothetical protein